MTAPFTAKADLPHWPEQDRDISVGLFWQALNVSHLALWRWSMAEGRLYFSSQFRHIAGLNPDAQLRSFDDLLLLMAPDQQERLLVAVGRAMKSQTRQLQCSVRLNQGICIQLRGGYERKSREIIGMVSALTSHQTDELSPNGHSQLFDGLFDSTQVASALLDANGVMVRANAACERLFQQAPHTLVRQLQGCNLLNAPLFSACSVPLSEVQQSLEQGVSRTIQMQCCLAHLLETQPADAQVLSLTGSFSPLLLEPRLASGSLKYILVQFENRSEEIRASKALARNSSLLDGVLDQRGAPSVAVKDLQGTYLLANDRYLELLSVQKSKVLGLRDENFLEGATASLLHRREQQAITLGHTITTEQSLPLVSEQPAEYLWSCFPLHDEKNVIFSVGHIFTDISHIQQQQQVIDNQRKELRLLLDSVQDIILYLDRWGRVRNSNSKAAQFFGNKPLMGCTLVEVFVNCPQINQLQREIMQVARTNFAEVGIVESLQFGEREYWFEIDKVPTVNGEGRVDGVMLVLRDVTKEKLIARELGDSESRYRAFISNSMDGIWCCRIDPPIDTNLPMAQQIDEMGERALFSECNQVMADFRDCRSPEELLGIPMFDRGIDVHRMGMSNFINANYRLLDIPTFRVKENGERLELTVSTLGIVENGYLKHVWGITRDVTEKHRYLAEMEYRANHDELTGLVNRNHLYRLIEQYFVNKPEAQQMALLLVDLNRFKDLNDTLGHQAGDALLKQIGPRVEDELSDTECIVARLGGDEFAVFLPSIRNSQQAVVIAHRVMEVIREPYKLDGYHSEIGAAIGIALRPQQANDVSTLMRFADVAMYNAKSQYSSIAIYSPDIDPHSPKRFALMSELRRAIRQNELFLHFQPKIELSSGRLHGFEALLRWNHPELGFVSPADFIPMAEVTDIIHPLTEWVLNKSIEQCKRWHDDSFFVSVAVNLSARNLMDERLPRKLGKLLEQYDLPATALELEITESSIMDDPTRALILLQQISDLDIKLSIDDFGTGYSSLAYLKKLPVQALKIDYSFVLNMLTDPQDEIIVKSTVNLAHNLGLDVVAEGVENEETLASLISMGCNQAQGFHLGRPMTADAVKPWFEASPWWVDYEGDVSTPDDSST